jgi:hypothetical protein
VAEAENALPTGQEPLPTTTISSLSVLRGDEVSVLSTAHGAINAAAEPAAGMYFRDARHLALLELRLAGAALSVVDSFTDGESLSATFTNAAAPGLEACTLLVRLRRLANHGLHDSLVVSNYGALAARFSLVVLFGADFEDLFVIRGLNRLRPPASPTAEVMHDEVRFR